jgi:hypothetical protein
MKLGPTILAALASNASGQAAPGLYSQTECRDNHEMCPRWAASCSLKQVYITCRKTCNKCQVPLVADFKPTVSNSPILSNYRRPQPPPQPKPVNNFFGGLFNSFRLPTLGKPVNARPQVVSPPEPVKQVVQQPVVAPVVPVAEVANARTVARQQMPYEVAVLLGLADPFAVTGPGSKAEGVPIREPLVLGPQAPVKPAPVPVQPVVAQPVVQQPIVQQPIVNLPVVNQPIVNEPVIANPAPVVVTTKAPTQAPTEAPTEEPTEEPEASGEASGEIEVTFEVAALPVVEDEVAALPETVEAIPDAVINEVIEPEMAARLMDAMCVDELVNCADASIIDFCSAQPGDDNYEKFVPFQKGCRRTCGICDKNASCPDLKDHCYDEGVKSICAATCRGF